MRENVKTNASPAASGDECARLNEKLRTLTAENGRLRAQAAEALRREEIAEGRVAQLERQLLYLRRRSLHWYLGLPARLLRRGDD